MFKKCLVFFICSLFIFDTVFALSLNDVSRMGTNIFSDISYFFTNIFGTETSPNLSPKKGVGGWWGCYGTDSLARLKASWGYNWNIYYGNPNYCWIDGQKLKVESYDPNYRFVPMIAGNSLSVSNRPKTTEQIDIFINNPKYSSTERYWLIGNEPNLPGQDYDVTGGCTGAADYYIWAMDTIKSKDPNAKIIIGGVASAGGWGSASGCVNTMKDIWIWKKYSNGQRRNICDDIDGWHVHIYGEDKIYSVSGEDSFDEWADKWTEWIRSFEEECGKDYELWITETGDLNHMDENDPIRMKQVQDTMTRYVNEYESNPNIDRYAWFYSSIGRNPRESIVGLYDPETPWPRELTVLGEKYSQLGNQVSSSTTIQTTLTTAESTTTVTTTTPTTTTIRPTTTTVTNQNFECISILSGCYRCSISYPNSSSDAAVLFLISDNFGKVRKTSLENIFAGNTQTSTIFCCNELKGNFKVSYFIYNDPFMTRLISLSVSGEKKQIECS